MTIRHPALRRMLLRLQRGTIVPWRIRRRLLAVCGLAVDRGAFIEPGLEIQGDGLTIGADAYVNRGCLIDCRGAVSIGHGVLIGPRVMLLTATHPVMDTYPRAGPTHTAPVTIEPHAWIGAGAVLLPGAHVGRGAVVAAGAVVKAALAPDGLYAGVPARLVRPLPGQQAAPVPELVAG